MVVYDGLAVVITMILVSGIGLHVIIIVNDRKLGMKKRKDDEAVTALGRL